MAIGRLSPRATVLTAFFLQALSFGGWFSRVGELQLKMGLSEATLGLTLMGLMTGALITYPLGPAAVERFGTRPVMMLAIPLTTLACALSVFAWDAWSFYFTLTLCGLGHGFSTMAINVEADRVEGLTGRRIMISCHGIWSLGFVASTLTATGMRALGVSPMLHLWLIAAVVVIATVAVSWPMQAAPPRPHAGSTKRTLFAVPTPPILLLAGTMLSCVVIEGSVFSWSVIYLRDTFNPAGWIQTLTLPAFLLATALGRLFTEPFVERHGPSRVAVVLSAISLIGLIPVAWGGSLPLALIGFALIGLGVSGAFPMALSAAARLGDRAVSANVAALSVLQRIVALASPPVVGLVAAQWSIAGAFAAMLPLPILAIALARHLEPRSLVGTARATAPTPVELPYFSQPRIRAIFFIHAISSGGLFSHLAAMQQALGVNEATLGLAFLGFPLGGILSFLFGARVIERVGTKVILLSFLPAISVGTALLFLMPTPLTLFLLFLAYGGVYSLPNTAMNIEADRVEAMTGQRIMNSCHGVWSGGQLIATALATVAAAAGMTPFVHLILLALVAVPLALLVTLPMTPSPPRAHAGAVRSSLALPTVAVLLLVAYAVGPTLLEGAIRTWSVIYMRDSFGSPAWVNTLTLPLFLTAQSIGRLNADSLVTRFGPVRVARILIAIAFLGMLAVTFAPNLYVALLGTILVGVGVCVTYPLATSASAQLGDRPSSQNVASFTLAVQTLLLGGPPLLGYIATAFDIRATFGVALPLLIASLWLARYLAPRR